MTVLKALDEKKDLLYMEKDVVVVGNTMVFDVKPTPALLDRLKNVLKLIKKEVDGELRSEDDVWIQKLKEVS